VQPDPSLRLQDDMCVNDGAGRRGDFMHTYSGIDFWPLDARACEVELEDIAHSLSRICRFNGHCGPHYSVAQHAFIVSHLVPDVFAYEALHHDDAEAYLADLVRPVKKNIAEYKVIERALERVIAERFCLLYPFPDAVKEIDGRIVADEAAALFKNVPPWTQVYEKTGARIVPVPAFVAKRLFLHRHKELTDLWYAHSLRAKFWRFVAWFIL